MPLAASCLELRATMKELSLMISWLAGSQWNAIGRCKCEDGPAGTAALRFLGEVVLAIVSTFSPQWLAFSPGGICEILAVLPHIGNLACPCADSLFQALRSFSCRRGACQASPNDTTPILDLGLIDVCSVGLTDDGLWVYITRPAD